MKLTPGIQKSMQGLCCQPCWHPGMKSSPQLPLWQPPSRGSHLCHLGSGSFSYLMYISLFPISLDSLSSILNLIAYSDIYFFSAQSSQDSNFLWHWDGDWTGMAHFPSIRGMPFAVPGAVLLGKLMAVTRTHTHKKIDYWICMPYAERYLVHLFL